MTKRKLVIIYFIYLLLFWLFYRWFFVQSELVDEVLVKPIIWLGPLFLYFWPKSGLSLPEIGFQKKGWLSAFFLSLGLGFVFLLVSVVANFFKYGHSFSFSASVGTTSLAMLVILILVTSIVEELVFRGFIFNTLRLEVGVFIAGLLTTVAWVVIHLPITFLWLDLTASVVYLLLTAIYGIGAVMVMATTNNLLAPILLHLFWSLPIILFR